MPKAYFFGFTCKEMDVSFSLEFPDRFPCLQPLCTIRSICLAENMSGLKTFENKFSKCSLFLVNMHWIFPFKKESCSKTFVCKMPTWMEVKYVPYVLNILHILAVKIYFLSFFVDTESNSVSRDRAWEPEVIYSIYLVQTCFIEKQQSPASDWLPLWQVLFGTWAAGLWVLLLRRSRAPSGSGCSGTLQSWLGSVTWVALLCTYFHMIFPMAFHSCDYLRSGDSLCGLWPFVHQRHYSRARGTYLIFVFSLFLVTNFLRVTVCYPDTKKQWCHAPLVTTNKK